MKKSFFSGLLILLPMLYGNSYASRPTDLEHEAAPQYPQHKQIQTPVARPAAMEKSVEKPMQRQTRNHGDRLQTPVAVTRHLDFPRRGTSDTRVQEELGRPLEIIPPVGKPPISRWVYKDRIVYFEYSSVIHVVAR